MDIRLFAYTIFALSLTQALAQYAPVDLVENVNGNFGSRIVSGWEAYPGQHPWQVSLRMVNSLGAVSACGGSVVHKNWIVTAAHCTASRVTIVVRAGVTNLTTPVYLSESTTWYNYPSYDDDRPLVVQPDDISLLKMNVPFTYNNLLKPIRVQSTADAYRNYEGERTIASGYGVTWTGGSSPEVLNWVYLIGVANQACFNVFGTIITSTTICAQHYNVTSQSTCQGDSGGPLVHFDADGVPSLIGVASFVAGGNLGCHSGFPAGFCRVGPFLSWFEEVTGIDFENLDESEESSEEETSEETSEEGSGEGSGESESLETEEGSGESNEGNGSDENGPETDNDPDCDSLFLKKLDVKVKVHVKLRK